MINSPEEQRWINFWKAFIQGGIAVNTVQAIRNRVEQGKLLQEEGDLLVKTHADAMDIVVDDIVRKSPHRLNKQLTRDEQRELVGEIAERTLQLVEDMIRAQRSPRN